MIDPSEFEKICMAQTLAPLAAFLDEQKLMEKRVYEISHSDMLHIIEVIITNYQNAMIDGNAQKEDHNAEVPF
ncbi:MAG: DUF6511 domain-containing protein [Alphaproteobacteria bacterium]